MKSILRTAAGLVLASALFLTAGHAQDLLPAEVQADLIKKYGAEARYMSASVDLNADSRPEVIVYVVGAGNCGTGGCPAVIYTPAGAGYRVVTTTSVTQTPIRLSPRSSHGWRNLIVRISGGGAKAGDAELEYNGKSYPTNPTVPPARRITDLAGATILVREMKSFDDARPFAASGPATPPSAASPSFDCAKAGSPSEKLICSDAALAAMDRKMAAVYEEGIRRWTVDGVAALQRAAQRNWIASRDRCGASKDCLSSSYTRRIVELQIQSGQLEAPKPVAYACKGSSDSLFASFYNQTDPPSAVLTLGPDKQVIALIAQSGSGARYTAPNVEFWEHQGEATLKWSDTTRTCRLLK